MLAPTAAARQKNISKCNPSDPNSAWIKNQNSPSGKKWIIIAEQIFSVNLKRFKIWS